MAQWSRIRLPMQETQEMQVRSLVWEDPLKKEIATYPVFLPGKSHGQRSLAGSSPWGRKESETTERLSTHISVREFPVPYAPSNVYCLQIFR